MWGTAQFMDNSEEYETFAKEPLFNAPTVVVTLVAVFLSIHAILAFAGRDWQIWSLYAFAFIPARISGGMAFPAIYGSQVWSFLTYAFLHGNWMHVIFNSLWMLIFGTVVARRLGTLRFLLLSGISAVGGAIATLLIHWGEAGVVIGASAAVSGVMAAAIPLMFAAGLNLGDTYRADLSQVRPLLPQQMISDRRALMFTIIWLAITLYSGATGWTGAAYVEEARIAWEAHLGGFAVGLMAFYLLDRRGDASPAQSC